MASAQAAEPRERARRNPDAHARNSAQLMSWLSEGKLRPAISERVSLRETPAALARLHERKVTGKIVVLPEA